jgi:hypothetical protein
MSQNERDDSWLGLAFLSVVLFASIFGYFVWRKTVHDADIAGDTRRIADAVSIDAAERERKTIPGMECKESLSGSYVQDNELMGHIQSWREIHCTEVLRP